MAHSDCVATIVWHRLDEGGHDACRVLRTARGWRLQGAMTGWLGQDVAHLAYDVVCDRRWRARRARVNGFAGARTVGLTIVREADGRWLLNHQEQPDARGCQDLDLAFTPATNLLAVRARELPPDETVAVPAAYLEDDLATLGRLEQGYRRIDARRIAYTAPRFGYAAELGIDEHGLVREYPGLFRAATEGVR